MSNTLLLINADGPETRVALVEDGLLGELYIERKQERGIAGNIYKGRVERVLPGMQAAFVNIGLEKSAYLHVSDVRGTPDDLKRLTSSGESSTREHGEDDEPEAPSGGARIEDLLKEGQEIVVQVTKEPISTKGARVTRYISLPGRHLVFMPTVEHVGISRRISSDKERRRLREIIDQMRPQGTGFIVRTVAENVPDKDLKADMDFLIKLWNNVVQRTETGRCPSLIYNDLDLLLRTVRDMFTPDVDKLIIDSRPEYDRIKKFIAAFMPDFPGQIELYTSAEPIFDGYGIEIEIDRALERKVWLKSGGYLIVDEMEALTAIDVNTGRFVGKRNLEDTITQTNLEAAREVAEQLRIRSIGGMIVVDFIDMDRSSNRNKVTRAFNDFLRRDQVQGRGHPHFGAGPGRDDAQADARVAAARPHRAVPALRGQGLHQVPAHGRLRAFARAATAGQSHRRRHGPGRGQP
jgi:ribonuclease G